MSSLLALLLWTSLSWGDTTDFPLDDLASDSTEAPCTAENLKEVIRADLEKQENKRDWAYFTAEHLKCSSRHTALLPSLEGALNKVLNSLSWAATPLTVEKVDGSGLLFRVNLALLKTYRGSPWRNQTWNRLLQSYPYRKTEEIALGDLVRLAGGRLPVIRADWFLARATVSPLYDDLLSLPSTLNGLANQLGIDLSHNISAGRVIRSGFSRSGVSVNNRIIERHRTRYGAFWLSYDFASNAGAQNIFLHPLDFLQAGGEVIFHLPNGFLGYAIYNQRDQKIPVAPVEIVSDPLRPDRAVRTAASCMRCHHQGFIENVDTLADTVTRTPRGYFSAHIVRKINRLHPSYETLVKTIGIDNARLIQSLETASIKTDADSVFDWVNIYDEPLSLKDVADELRVPEQEVERLIRKSKYAFDLRELHSPAGSVSRSNFENFVQKLIPVRRKKK